jgi:hypothetical protein
VSPKHRQFPPVCLVSIVAPLSAFLTVFITAFRHCRLLLSPFTILAARYPGCSLSFCFAAVFFSLVLIAIIPQPLAPA